MLLIDAEGEKQGEMPISAALDAAREAGLDLVEVAPNSNPPVWKILDYGKFRFEEQKKKAETRKKAKRVELKGNQGSSEHRRPRLRSEDESHPSLLRRGR